MLTEMNLFLCLHHIHRKQSNIIGLSMLGIELNIYTSSSGLLNNFWYHEA